MSLKIYIAAPWVNKKEALEAQERFEAAGFEVTSRWIKYQSETTAEDMGNPDKDQEFIEEAFNDVQDIMGSDVFVILNLGLSEGKATEMGIAYAMGLPVLLIGKRERNIFYWLPDIFRTDTVELAIEGILVAENRRDTEMVQPEVLN